MLRKFQRKTPISASSEKAMKQKLLTAVCVLAFFSTSVTPCLADSDKHVRSLLIGVLRPSFPGRHGPGLCIFVVSLPFTAASGTIKETAHTLVVSPPRPPFKRPLGSMDVRHNGVVTED